MKSMSKARGSALKSSSAKNSRSVSGVLAARTVTAPPKQKNEFTLSPQTHNATAEIFSKKNDVSDAISVNERLIEDSEFLLQATLFIQTAGEQLNSIESSLKRPTYTKNSLGPNIENGDDVEYAQEVVRAILNGHNFKSKKNISVPTRLQRPLLTENETLEPAGRKTLNCQSTCDTSSRGEAPLPCLKSSLPSWKESKASFKMNGQPNLNRRNSFVEVSQTLSSTKSHFPSLNTVSDYGRSEADEDNLIGDKPMRYDEYCVSDETRCKDPAPYQVTRKKLTIEDVPISVATNTKPRNNAALISIQCDRTKAEESNHTISKTVHNSLKIQAVASINIKPALIQETFTQVDIQPCKSLQKKCAVNKNVSFLEVVHDESNKMVEQEIPTPENNFCHLRKKQTLKNEKSAQIGQTNCRNIPKLVQKQESLFEQRQESFDRKKLDEILNTITDKLVACIQIPDEILEHAIDRLWILGDYLEDMYTNSAEGFRQKVRLNFTSLWLHEIIRLIDIEMKRKSNSLSSGVATIVQYIISEVQCESSVNYQHPCIIAEENDEIKFYCKHDSSLDQSCKYRHENQVASLQSPSSLNRPLRNSLTSPALRKTGGQTSLRFSPARNQKLKDGSRENIESKIPQMYRPSSDKVISKTVLNFPHKQKPENRFKPKNLTHFGTEKPVTSKIKNTDRHGAIFKNNLNFYENCKFMDAHQRQKVIQKLGAEVEKMLSWHKHLQLRDHPNVTSIPIPSISGNACSSASVTNLPPKIIPSITLRSPVPPSKDGTNNAESCNKQVDSEVVCKEATKGTNCDVTPFSSNSLKSHASKRVSPINLNGEYAYDDDWEEDSKSSAEINGSQYSCQNVMSSEGSKSISSNVKKPDPVEIYEDVQVEGEILDDVPSKANSGNSAPGVEKSVVTSANYDVTSKILETDSQIPEAVRLGGISFSNSVMLDSLTNDIPLNDHPSETSVAFENNIASDFSEQESAAITTRSDNTEKSDSGRKKSYTPSEADCETVKDLSQLSSEVAVPEANISMSLQFEENSFKENDSGRVQQSSECKLNNEKVEVIDNEGLKIEVCKQSKLSCELELRQPVTDNGASMKLLMSCQELAKNVSCIEKIKIDLLRAFDKSEKERSPTDSHAWSLPEVAKISSGKGDKSRSHSAPSFKFPELRQGNDDSKKKMSVSKMNIVASEKLSDDCENLSYIEAKISKNTKQCQAYASESGEEKNSHPILQSRPASKNFSDSSSESNVNESVTKLDVQTIVGAFSVNEDSRTGQPSCDLSFKSSVNVSNSKPDDQTLAEVKQVHKDLDADRAFSDLTSESSMSILSTEYSETHSKAFSTQNDLESNEAFSDVSFKSGVSVSNFKHVAQTPLMVRSVHEDLEPYKAFSDLSYESSVNVSAMNLDFQKPERIPEASSHMQPVFASNTWSDGEVLVNTDSGEGMKVEISTESKFKSHGDLLDAEVREKKFPRSFIELSNEILKHLKLESELLMQLYPPTSEVVMPTAMRSVSEAKGMSTKIVALAPNSSSDITSSHSESEIDGDGVVYLSSVESAEFECLMSQLSENVRESTLNMNELSGDSIPEIFSDTSSERFRVDCSQDLEASIKEVLFDDIAVPSNFMMEHF